MANESAITGPLAGALGMTASVAATAATRKALQREVGGFDTEADAAAAGLAAMTPVTAQASAVGLNAMVAAMDARYAGTTGWSTVEAVSSPITAVDLGATPRDLIAVTMSGSCAIEIPTAWLTGGKAVRVNAPSTCSAETPVVLSTQGTEKISGADTWTLNGASQSVLLAPNAAQTAWIAVRLHTP